MLEKRAFENPLIQFDVSQLEQVCAFKCPFQTNQKHSFKKKIDHQEDLLSVEFHVQKFTESFSQILVLRVLLMRKQLPVEMLVGMIWELKTKFQGLQTFVSES